MVKIGELVKHSNWRDSPLPHYREEIGIVVADDPDTKEFVQVVWLPYNPPQCQTFHSRTALERISD